jgi:glycosyltransferase involved in cell wall biosynthesis
VNRAPLRVALTLGQQPGGGIARFAMELAVALDRRSDVDLVPIGPGTRLLELLRAGAQGAGAIELAESTAVREAAQVLVSLGTRSLRARVDVLHCTKHLTPARRQVPTVLTVYDLTVLDDRTERSPVRRHLLPPLYRRSIRTADAVTTISAQVGSAVADRFPGVRPTPIDLAAPSRLLDAAPDPSAGLAPRSFALFVGDLNDRKNAGFLLELWPEVHRATGLDLVLAGGDGAESPTLAAARRAPNVTVTGPVSDGRLRWLYESCAVACVPSRAEGFGLPLAEAVALGCPVIASDLPVFRDLTGPGDRVRLEALDPTRWSQALRNLSEQPGSASTSSIRTWDEVADEYVTVYRSLVRRPLPVRQGTICHDL